MIRLPAGHHYSVMWGIPHDYAGMTKSMFQRSRAFVEQTGTTVTIVTHEHQDDYDLIRQRLTERGALADGMPLVNMWEDLRRWDDEQLRKAAGGFTPGLESTFEPLGSRGDHASPLVNYLRDDEGEILQVDYFRDDGTILASDRPRRNGAKTRSVTLCDSSGEPIGTWRMIRPLYFMWLDSLPRDPVAWMIVDSKTAANHMVDYRRDDVVTIHVIRGTHLKPGTGRPLGELNPSRRKVMVKLARWDAAVFLTHHQRDDVDALLGPLDNLHVIPNSRNVPLELPSGRRQRGKGVMLAGLNPRKRVGHAISAMQRVRLRALLYWPRLDVWGRGINEGDLKAWIKKRHAPVRLRGHSPTALEEFAHASYSLLTSSSEASPNALIESMGYGCLPISYDIPYGPADIITHGVNGFLVPDGDIPALTDQILEVVRARPATLAPLREAAHRRALEFSDENVVRRWADLLGELNARRKFDTSR